MSTYRLKRFILTFISINTYVPRGTPILSLSPKRPYTIKFIHTTSNRGGVFTIPLKSWDTEVPTYIFC